MTGANGGRARLRALDLQGYKTFASKAVFEFAPTITAIVGPNGSGNPTSPIRSVGFSANSRTACCAARRPRT
jgi:hypothetical protein